MPRSRRALALLLSILLLHVTWVGSGYACVMPEMESQGAMDMTGMDMSGMDMAGMAGGGAGDAPSHDHAACELPWSAADCQSLAPCAPVAIASPAQSLAMPEVDHAPVASQVALAPPSQVRAPELPPPRA